MEQKFKTTWFWANLGKVKGEETPRYVDFDEYAQGIEKAYNDLDEAGYEVVEVIPMQMGKTESSVYGLGGYGITRGAVVVGKKKGSD